MKIPALACLAFIAAPTFATAAPPAICRTLAAELAPRVAIDQRLRELSMQEDEPAAADGRLPKIWDQIAVVDRGNTRFLKRFVQRCGWPGGPAYGEKVVDDAWLLVQHADQDPAFQAQALRLIEAKVEQREVPARHLAYLSDRAATAQGRPQLYGTQLVREGECSFKPKTLDDPAAVDARRARHGMQPLADYLRQATAHLGGPHCAGKP